MTIKIGTDIIEISRFQKLQNRKIESFHLFTIIYVYEDHP